MRRLIVREAQELLNTIMDEVGGFEGSPEQWDSILEVLQKSDCSQTYLNDQDAKISQHIIKEAIAVAKEEQSSCS